MGHGSHGRILIRRLCTHSGPGVHQTPIVDALWARRKQVAPPTLSGSGPKAVVDANSATLLPRTPADSCTQVTYPFSTDPALVERYRNPWSRVRVGRLLEDLDALAGTIAFKHCKSNATAPTQHIVTASVDRIAFHHRPDLRDDIVLSGSVQWVGSSSMEIAMRAVASWTETPFMEAVFTFVARDIKTGGASRINPLDLANGTAAQRKQAEMGDQRAVRRKEKRKEAMERAKMMPVGGNLDAAGLAAAQGLLRESQQLLSMPSLAPPTDILLSATMHSNMLITQPQQRNTAGRIFGGFLMRRGFELAFATAYMFCGRRPVFLELDDVTFRQPVNIGDLVRFTSCVLYTSEVMDSLGRATIHVEVVASVSRPEERTTVQSNVFHFTFGAAGDDHKATAVQGDEIELRRVLPSSLEEACRIVTRYQADLVQRDLDLARTGL